MRHLIVTACLSLSCSAIAETWTVDDDGPADFDNIQAAVDAASDGDEILVEPGIYTGAGDSVINMLGKAITLQSTEGANVTVIDGENLRLGIRCGNSETNKTRIDGFLITRGFGTQGGGMSNGDDTFGASNPTVSNCHFIENSAVTSGGGMYNSRGSSPTVANCLFIENTTFEVGGAGICNRHGSSPVLTDCIIKSNVCLSNGWDTWGGGMHCTDASTPQVSNCIFENNIAIYGGGISIKGAGSNATLTHTNICGNQLDQIYGQWTDNGDNTISDECSSDCYDITGDGLVSVNDVLFLIAVWGTDDIDADVNNDGIVGTDDLLAVIGNWGPCP